MHMERWISFADIQVDVGHKAEGALNEITHNHESMIEI
jgi:hypothetical protein